MTFRSMRGRLLASTMIVGAFAAATAGQAAAQATSAPVRTAPSAPGAGSGAPAFGPQAAETPQTSGEGASSGNTVSVVTVTGSRIPQPNLTATSPVTAVGSQELKFEGTTDAINALDQLPQTNGDLGNTPNPLGGGEGITTVNLRGLGAARTLVLQDGKRLMPGDPTVGGTADIDQIPSELIDRIDVLTGGASAVYGSDAVAGVVNFVMKHNFQGVQFDVQGGFDQSGNHESYVQALEKEAGDVAPSSSVTDGQQFIASVIFGANTPDGKGNVEGFFSYRHQDPVSEGARDYSGCLLEADGGHGAVCSGSENSNLIFDANSGAEYGVKGNQFVPFGTSGTSPPAIFNSSPYEYLQREDERYQSGFFAHYQVVPQAELYNDFTFTEDRTQENIAPSGSFLGGASTPGDPDGLLDVNCQNPLLSAQQVASLTCVPLTGGASINGITTYANGAPITVAQLEVGRRNIEGGPRTDNYDHLGFREVGGIRGDLSDAWHYDAYAQYGYTRYNNEVGGYFSNSRLASALVVDPTTGKCLYQIPGAPACVPYNLFQQGGVNQAQLNYLTENGEAQGYTQEQVAHFDITGELGKYGIKSPFADRGVGVNLGAEYRREELVYSPDQVLQNNDLAGGAGASLPVNGSFDVYELFGEIVAPIVTDRPFVKDLTFNGGYRFSDYSTAGHVDTYKLSMEYAPVSDVRVRGSFQRAVRAPNVNELFSPAVVTNTSDYIDPCAAIGATGNVASSSLAQCERTGVTAAQYGNGIALGKTVGGVAGTNSILECPASQCATEIGGNTALKPETSDTVSYGAIFTPRYLPGFDFSVDFYHIDVKGAVSTIPLDTTLTQCENTGSATFCDLIKRAPTGGLFGTSITGAGYIIGTDVNVGAIKTSGLDFEGDYRYNLNRLGFGDIGRLSLNFDGTYTQHFIDTPLPGLGSYDCAGYYGNVCGSVPRWKSKLRLTYAAPWRWTVSAQWRYVGAQRLDSNQPNPVINSGTFDAFDASRGSVDYIDLSGSWTIRDNLTLRAGVNNVTDRDPPILSTSAISTGAPNAQTGYDLLGRTFYFGVTADF